MEKITAIIPTYNRFKYLIHNLHFIKNQTYSNLEIIIVNDCSSEKEYYEHNWEKEGVIIIHLPERTKEMFGYSCVGYVRNIGIDRASGKYIAFCDDDDTWLPNKLELQMKAMMSTDCKMSCTDGLYGSGLYNPSKKYKRYNAEHHYKTLQRKYKPHGDLLAKGFPQIWTYRFIKIHNCIINSSVVVEKDILIEAGKIPNDKRGQDYKAWLNCIKYTNCVYVDDICFYYDSNHGSGSNH